MIKEEKLEEILKEDLAPAKIEEAKGLNRKVFIIGIPAFIVQLIVVYFIMGYMITSKIQGHTVTNDSTKTKPVTVKKVEEKPDEAQNANFIYSIEDIVVNPAETDGKRLLLLSLGISVRSEEDKTEMKTKEILVKDAIISTISSKNLFQLNSAGYKDTLKIELTQRIKQIFPKVHLHQVYFSKFILQ
ncbi:MAG: flagellar basal body-associated FliL family protein [Ignavibacteriaceae bacterium]|jgi:flagellar FliL protein|nr:flagellar basal body-associated FliL family protein [Ignavibacteriaceae bacterium]